jgi:lysozyme family protein
MNVGLIPRTQSAIVDYQRWLLPEYDGREEETSAHSGSTRTKEGATKVECFWATCYFISEIDVIGGSFAYPCRKCVTIPLGPEPSPVGTKPDGNECWKTDTCRPGGNARGDAVERRGCDGDPAASLDHCGRCVGGDTGRRAADAGADCSKDDDCTGTLGGSAYLDTCNECVGGSTQKIACCASMSNNITRVIEDEGGYVNQAHDRGGKTKYGITRRTWNTYASRIGADPATRDVSTITESEAREIYERFYYQSSNAEAIARMDGDLAMIYFNFFVNTPRGAVKAMQDAVVYLRGEEVFQGGRGRVGQMTLGEIQKLINEGRLNDLHNRFKVEMQHHYNREVANDSKQSSFINGWTNRINKFPNKTDERKHNLHCK